MKVYKVYAELNQFQYSKSISADTYIEARNKFLAQEGKFSSYLTFTDDNVKINNIRSI